MRRNGRWRHWATIAVLGAAICVVNSCHAGSGSTTTASTLTSRSGTAMAVSGPVDAFDRPDSVFSLGASPEVGTWQAEAGVWGITAGHAYVAAPVPTRNIAVVDAGRGDGAVQVRLSQAVTGAGLVFRFQDMQNYWILEDIPEYATFALVKVVAGHQDIVANTGLSPVQSGVTVAVKLDGAVIDLVLNSKVVISVVDGSLKAAHRAGVGVQSSVAGDARFSDFTLGAPPGTLAPTTSVPAVTTTVAAGQRSLGRDQPLPPLNLTGGR